MNRDQESLNQYLIEHFNLQDTDIGDIHFESVNYNGKFTNLLKITLQPKPIRCPNCDWDHPKIKGYTDKTIHYSFPGETNTKLIYHARRYKCPVCGRTYYEHSPFVFKNMRISIKTVLAVLKDLKSGTETFSSTAARYGLSVTSVISIFDKHVQISRKKLPRFMCLDEVYAMRTPGSKYICVILDFEKHVPIDVRPTRYKKDLIHYFLSIPLEERKTVEMVCFDMYPTYRDVVKTAFPNALGVVDHFHICQEFYRQFDQVRIRVMKKIEQQKKELLQELKALQKEYEGCAYEKDPQYWKLKAEYKVKDDQYYALKKFNWLLRQSEKDFIQNGKKRPNRHFNMEVSLKDILEILLECDPAIAEIMRLKRDLTEMYERSDYENGQKEVNKVIAEFSGSWLKEMQHFGKTMRKWRNEIVNSFIPIDRSYKVRRDGYVTSQDHRMHNGIIENRNKIIKCLKNNANGYTNWERFRNRILYVLDPETSHSLEPIYPSKAVKKQKK